MATELYNNLNLRKSKHIDSRLLSVQTIGHLLNPNSANNFLYEGAKVYVKDEVSNFQVQDDPLNPGTLIWVNIGGSEQSNLVVGNVNILPTSTILDLSLVSPSIELCHSVIIDITGGLSANITSIINFPTNAAITFYVEQGKTLKLLHNDYDVALVSSIVLEDGFDMTIKGRSIGNESVTLVNDNGVLCQWDATQFVKSSELNNALVNLSIVDNLTTADPTKALSAKQGTVLKGLVGDKQDQLTEGSHIGISGAVISAEPWGWKQISIPPSQPASALGYLTTLAPGTIITESYNLSDLRVYNQGLWMLPVNLDDTVAANWILLDAPASGSSQQITSVYKFYNSTSPHIVNNNVLHRIITNSLVGDAIPGIIFNNDGPANYKSSFSLPIGKYKIIAKINLVESPPELHFLTLQQFDGVGSDIIGVPPGALVATTVASSPSDFLGIPTLFQEVSYYVNVTATNVMNGFMVTSFNGSSDYTGLVTNNYPATLEITKL